MKCRWEWSCTRKMIIFGLSFVLILIRQTVSLEDDYKFTWSNSVKQKPYRASYQYSGESELQFSPSHPHRHRHNNLRESKHDLHAESVKLEFENYKKLTRANGHKLTISKTGPPTRRINLSSMDYARPASLGQLSHESRNIRYKAFRKESSEMQQRRDNNPNLIEFYLGKNIGKRVSAELEQNVHHATNIENGLVSSYHKLKQTQIFGNNEKLKGTLQNRKYVESIKPSRDILKDENDNQFQYDYLDDEPQIYDDSHANFSKTESITEEKWKNYGTLEAVEKSRRRYAISESQSAASAHIQRIKEDSKCRWPHPKIIPVTEASKRFVPHCTILHRCGDDTGCCDYDTKTCVAKATTTVQLHFFVIPLAGSATVEVRSFVNHTECHCVDRCILTSCSDSARILYPDSYEPLKHLNQNETCSCPSHYDVDQNEFTKGRCRCDCFTHNQGCKTLKEGLDGFPGEDRRCILEEKCHTPVCQYGRYNTLSGRCPSSNKKQLTVSQYSVR